MLRKIINATLLFASLCIAPSAQAILITASASLDGLQQVPANASPATGDATVIFNTDTNTLDLTATIEGLFLSDITFGAGDLFAFGLLGPLHIHVAPPGTNGPIGVAFNQASYFTDTATGMDISAIGVSYTPSDATLLLAGNLYLNLHTLAVRSGEIRGQLNVVPEPLPLTLLGTGLIGIWLVRRRQRQG